MFGETPVPGEVCGHRVELAHHAHAGAGGRDDGLVTAEDLDEASHEGYCLALVSRVEVHLAAARLRAGKVYLHPETFENLDRSPARLGEERVVEAGYEERDAHRYVPFSSVSESPMIDHPGYSARFPVGPERHCDPLCCFPGNVDPAKSATGKTHRRRDVRVYGAPVFARGEVGCPIV